MTTKADQTALAKARLLMGVDPGVNIGVALKIDGVYMTMTVTDTAELYQLITDHKPDAVVVELFHRSGRIDRNMTATIENVGGVKAACHSSRIPVYKQHPGNQKAFGWDAKQIIKRGYTPHEMSALSHLLRFEDNLKEGKAQLA